jgi:4-hydroxybenzoate polyprenyltransferase
LRDDLKIGVKSTAVTWHNKNPKLIMERFAYIITICHLSLTLFDSDYAFAVPVMLIADYLLIK